MDDVIPDPTKAFYIEETSPKKTIKSSSRFDPTANPTKKISKKPKSSLKRRQQPVVFNHTKKESVAELISSDINIQFKEKEEEPAITGETPRSNNLIAVSHIRSESESHAIDLPTGRENSMA